MRTLKGWTLVVGILLLIVAAQGNAASSTVVSNVYTVGSLTKPGVDTGLVLQSGQSVTVIATGTVCAYLGECVGPNGDSSVDTTQSLFGGFLLPGAPAYGLVGRVGNGPWMQVGSGPTTLYGTGDLVFAVNDDLYVDNSGSFTVTVTPNGCYPGNGYGDTNHSHSGPPGQGTNACWPGNGYGDTNHSHSGPPGQASKPTPSGDSSSDTGGSRGGRGHH